jgi:hypothetical protein
MGVSWDGKPYSFWVFSFYLHQKFIFYFLNAKNEFFMKEVQKVHIKIAPPQF